MREQSPLIAARDWRCMIILDACRHDVFQQCFGEGKVESVNTRVTDTGAWYKLNWNNDRSADTCLVSDQPVPWKYSIARRFAQAVHNWRRPDYPHPGSTLDRAAVLVGAHDRMLIHLIPPHLPYIGPRGRAFLLEKFDYDVSGSVKTNARIYDKCQAYGQKNGWEELRKYYAESLLYALQDVRRVLPQLPRPLVITADHGEALGEPTELMQGKETYYHSNVRHRVVQVVPWVEIL